MSDREPRRDCAYYQWGDGVYPRELGARCVLHGEFFSRNQNGLLPQCAGCKWFLAREEEGAPGHLTVMMLQSRLAGAEKRAKALQQIVDKCRDDYAAMRGRVEETAALCEAHFVRGVALAAALVADGRDATTTYEILNECSASWPEMVAAGVDTYDLVRIVRTLASTGDLRALRFYEVEPRERFNKARPKENA